MPDKSLEQRAAESLPGNFAIIPTTDLATASYEPPEFVVEGLIPVGHVTLLGAHGGAGKSQLALIIAAHCAAGRNWAGLHIARRQSAFVSLEDAGPLILYRLKRIVETYGLDAEQVEQGLMILDGSDGQAALATEVSLQGTRQIMPTASMEEMRELVADAGLIVVDNASDAFDGAENDRRQVRGFVRMLTRIARDNNGAVLLLAHIDKAAAKFGSAGNSYSGSTAWHNSARSRLAMVQADGGLELRQEKLNLGRVAGAIELAWSDDGVLIPSRTGPDNNREAQRDAQAAADDLRVLSAIDAAIAAGASVPIARTGPATTLGLLRTVPELGSEFNSRVGKERFWGALSRLAKAGKIVREPYRDAYRNARERWVRTNAVPADGNGVRQFVSCVNPPVPPTELTRGSDAPVSFVSSEQVPGTNATNATNADNYRAAKDGG